jgi:hypothetical protein
MTDDEVKEFENATSEAHWNELCDKIKSKYGGYPSNWFAKIVPAASLVKRNRVGNGYERSGQVLGAFT